MKKRIVALIMGISFLFMSCAGMSLFPDAEPLCPAQGDADTSIICKYVDPRTADFTLMLGVASILDKDPSKAPLIESVLLRAKILVESGVSYEVFSKELITILGPMQFVVINPLLSGFKNFKIPISDWDKNLILGHIDNQLELVRMIAQ